jgi:hypothetical protein
MSGSIPSFSAGARTVREGRVTELLPHSPETAALLTSQKAAYHARSCLVEGASEGRGHRIVFGDHDAAAKSEALAT